MTNNEFDFFVSYARKDNENGWITGFVEELLAQHRKFSGGRELTCFFDKDAIRGLDDWRHRIHHGLAGSRLFLALISPNYFAGEWCRKEWKIWIDLEIAKHILSSGAAPIHIVEVPGLVMADGLQSKSMLDDEGVAEQVARLCGLPEPHDDFVRQAAPAVKQFRRRQVASDFVRPFLDEGIEALRREDLRKVLETLARDLDARAEEVKRAAESPSTLFPQNRNFSGRLDELLDLRQRLKDDRAGVITGIHGLGGIGKTELALTYAHAFAGAYPGGRFNVPCERKASLREAALVLGDLFRDKISDEERMTPDAHFAAVCRCLRQRLEEKGHILLVLDNVTDRELVSAAETDQLTALGPRLHLLATTRLAPSGQANWLTLGELAPEEALELLEKYRPFTGDEDWHAARSIVKRLGGFALAIELVAAWLAQHPSATYAGLADGLGLQDLDTLAEAHDFELRRHNHERRLHAVLGPSLDSLTPAERRTMDYAALLPPDLVPVPWLKELVTADFPELSKPNKFGDPWQELIHRLMNLALLSPASEADSEQSSVSSEQSSVSSEQSSVTSEQSPHDTPSLHHSTIPSSSPTPPNSHTSFPSLHHSTTPSSAPTPPHSHTPTPQHSHTLLRCHRLIQDLLQSSWTEEERKARQDAINGLARQRAAALEKTTRWREARWEVEPLAALAMLWADTAHPGAAWLLNQAGLRCYALADWNRAEPLMRRALAIDEASLGEDHPNVATDLNNLAQLLQATNRLAEAEPLMRRALAISEASFGEDHPTVATSLNNLALLLKATDRLAEAEPLMRRALAIDEASLGEDHPNVATRLNNLAGLLEATNRLAEAEPLMRRALAIDEASFGEDHPNVAIRLNNLALLLQATNRLSEAEPLMRRALAIVEASFGEDHPNVATSLNNLALLLQDTNRLSEAEPLMRRALAIYEASYGQDHPHVAASLNNLALLLKATDRLAEAEPLFRRALAISEASFGEDHPNVAASLNNLAALLKDTNRLAEAEPLMRRALAISEASFGEDHPDVATDLNNLALLLQATDRLAEAEPLMRRALAIYEASYGQDHPHVAASLNNLAALLKATNRLAEAEPLMRRMVEIFLKFTRATGHPHAHLNAALGNYADLLQAMGKGDTEVRQELNDLLAEYGLSLGGTGGQPAGGPSPELRAVMEELMRDPSKASEIAARLQREDPDLLMELMQWLQSQQ